MPGQKFIWTPARDALLRSLREDGCTISDMMRELRTNRDNIRRRVDEQEAEEREAKAVVSAPAVIHPRWLEMEGEEDCPFPETCGSDERCRGQCW
jgi:hypothetical protein